MAFTGFHDHRIGLIDECFAEGKRFSGRTGLRKYLFQNSTFTNNLACRLAIVEPDRVRFRPALAWIAVAICFPMRQPAAPGSRCAMCSPAQGIDQRYREPYNASQRVGVPVGVYG